MTRIWKTQSYVQVGQPPWLIRSAHHLDKLRELADPKILDRISNDLERVQSIPGHHCNAPWIAAAEQAVGIDWRFRGRSLTLTYAKNDFGGISVEFFAQEGHVDIGYGELLDEEVDRWIAWLFEI